jgi:hypothetical protein
MSKEIILRRHSFVAIVDDEDFERFNNVLWFAMVKSNGKVYAYRGSHPDGTDGAVLLHRLVMSAPKGVQVDHINGNGLDCQKGNLRFCTPQQNARNRHRKRGAISPYKGVRTEGDKFSAQIVIDGRRIRLGRYVSAIEAAHAYDKAALERFGEFARVNFSGERLA